MVIDLAKCVGCDACSVACKVENSTPGDIWWAPVVHSEVGKFPKARLSFLPTLCMHCEDPPCQKSCPTKSISRRDDGIVVIDENKCAGSRACVTACPYNAISVWDTNLPMYENGPTTSIDELSRQKHKLGSAQKCTFCSHRMDAAFINHLTPGVDRAATPACVITCPAECRIFGNIEDSSSPPMKYVEEAIKRNRPVFVLRPDSGAKPKVAYVI
jgi:Fe-S-cluster-containing dehydrogenase component